MLSEDFHSYLTSVLHYLRVVTSVRGPFSHSCPEIFIFSYWESSEIHGSAYFSGLCERELHVQGEREIWQVHGYSEIWQVQPSTNTWILFHTSIPARSTIIWRILRSLQPAGCNSGSSFLHTAQEPASTANPLERDFLPFELVILHNRKSYLNSTIMCLLEPNPPRQ